MVRLLDLRNLFVIVALLEAAYFAAGMMPPNLVLPLTGWNLGADGQWITKLLAVSLGTQAYVAWILRKAPHLGVAAGLAFYQLASATADWVMWLVMADQGIFDNTLARTTVAIAIVSHYALGVLLVLGILRTRSTGES